MSRITPFQIAMGIGAAGALVDVSSYADLAAGVQRSWGRQTEFEDVPPGTLSFVLDNSDGRFTPGNTASPLTTTVTEGMQVCWNAGGRLVAGTILAIEPTFPSGESAWAQIRITCDDMLGNTGRRSLTNLLDSLSDAATPYLLWKLDDAAGTTVPVESVGSGVGLTLSGANGSVFGSAAISGLNGETQLSLRDNLASTGGNAWPVLPFAYESNSLGFYSFWVTPQTTSKVTASVSLSGFENSLQFGFNAGTYFVREGDTGGSAWLSTDTTATPHFLSMGLTSSYDTVWRVQAYLYLDGVVIGEIQYSATFASLTYLAPTGLSLTAS